MLSDLEVLLLKAAYEEKAQQHIELYKKLFDDGVFGGDKRWPNLLKHKSQFSTLLYLFGEELTNFNRDVNELHETYKKKKDLSVGEVTNCLLYMFRGGQIKKMTENTIEQDEGNTDKNWDPAHWAEMKRTFQEQMQTFKTINENMLFVLTSFAGDDWSSKMPDVHVSFTLYSEYWQAHANF